MIKEILIGQIVFYLRAQKNCISVLKSVEINLDKSVCLRRNSFKRVRLTTEFGKFNNMRDALNYCKWYVYGK